jgi:hypothetical protein
MTYRLDGAHDHHRASGLTQRLKTVLIAFGETQRMTPTAGNSRPFSRPRQWAVTDQVVRTDNASERAFVSPSAHRRRQIGPRSRPLAVSTYSARVDASNRGDARLRHFRLRVLRRFSSVLDAIPSSEC